MDAPVRWKRKLRLVLIGIDLFLKLARKGVEQVVHLYEGLKLCSLAASVVYWSAAVAKQTFFQTIITKGDEVDLRYLEH